jgi:hypothetical protein
MMANNEIGNIYPIKEIAKIAHENNILFHSDAVQAAGKIKIDVEDLGVDMLSISGHKINVPKGIGVLYIKDKRFIPLSMYAQTGMGPTEIFNLTSGTGISNSNNILHNLSTFNYNSSHLNGCNSMNYLLPTNHSNNRKLSREEIFNITKLNEEMNISYKDFLRLLCAYQIKNRDKYLKNFVELFRKHDKDLDGILNENEFSNLIRDIPFCKNNADEYIFKFLSIIDPFNNKKITFSECISILSMEIVEENFIDDDIKEKNTEENNKDKKDEKKSKIKRHRNQISLLDKICSEY